MILFSINLLHTHTYIYIQIVNEYQLCTIGCEYWRAAECERAERAAREGQRRAKNRRAQVGHYADDQRRESGRRDAHHSLHIAESQSYAEEAQSALSRGGREGRRVWQVET